MGSRRRWRCSRADRSSARRLDCAAVTRHRRSPARRQHGAAHRRHRRHRRRDRPRAGGARGAAAGHRAPRGRAAPPAEELGARAVVSDLAVAGEVDRLAGAALEADVDVLVANAAHPASGLLSELTQEQIDRMLDVNLRAPIALARVAGPGDGGARAAATWCSSPRSRARRRRRPPRCTRPPSSGCAGFALGLREDLRGHRRRRLGGRARASSASRACSPTPASSCPPGVGTQHPAGRR